MELEVRAHFQKPFWTCLVVGVSAGVLPAADPGSEGAHWGQACVLGFQGGGRPSWAQNPPARGDSSLPPQHCRVGRLPAVRLPRPLRTVCSARVLLRVGSAAGAGLGLSLWGGAHVRSLLSGHSPSPRPAR